MTKHGVNPIRIFPGDMTNPFWQSQMHIVHICAHKLFKHVYIHTCTQCAYGTGKFSVSQPLGTFLCDPFHFCSLAPQNTIVMPICIKLGSQMVYI